MSIWIKEFGYNYEIITIKRKKLSLFPVGQKALAELLPRLRGAKVLKWLSAVVTKKPD